MSQIVDDYLKRLRELLPSRSVGLYMALNGTYPVLSTTPTELPKWLPFVVLGLCLVVQVLLGIFNDKKKWYVIVFSGLALCLYGITLPYVGILGILGASSVVYLVFILVTIAFVTVVPMLVTEFKKEGT